MLDGGRRQASKQRMREIIAHEGALRVPKSSGCFVAEI
jgi:hypothetical protein